MASDDAVSFTIEPLREDIESTHGFLSTINYLRLRHPNVDHKFWYRGLSDCCFKLKPSVGRKQRYAGRSLKLSCDQEKWLLHRFRRRAYPYVGRAITAGEAIFLARHHRLPTRLLDWTANALFALYFASTTDQERDGRVWAMLRRPGDQDLDAFKLARCKDERKLFNYLSAGTRDPGRPTDAIRIVYPFYNSPRLVAQDGAFTIHSNPWKSIESYEGKRFQKENLDIEKLYRWCVPAKNKTNIVKELSSLGVTQRSLFPDLDGVAESLWERRYCGRVSPAPGNDTPPATSDLGSRAPLARTGWREPGLSGRRYVGAGRASSAKRTGQKQWLSSCLQLFIIRLYIDNLLYMCFYRDQGIEIFSNSLMAGGRTKLAVLLFAVAPESQYFCGKKVNGR